MAERWYWIRKAYEQRCLHQQEWWLGGGQQFGFTLKCIICILFNLTRPDPNKWNEWVEVAYLRSGTSYCPGEPTEYWYEAIVVGYGWRDWWFDVWMDGS